MEFFSGCSAVLDIPSWLWVGVAYGKQRSAKFTWDMHNNEDTLLYTTYDSYIQELIANTPRSVTQRIRTL